MQKLDRTDFPPDQIKYRFIDLFAGLGGFNSALKSLGHKCVFACENDQELARIYEQNFGIQPSGDIRYLDISSIPKHDVLCAGFPCQPFSKAGDQLGFDCPKWGNLFDYVVSILQSHKPKYFILENVPNLLKHHDGKTWQIMKSRLKRAGYSVREKLLSPHEFGIPQIRKRAYIVGRRGGISRFEWPSNSSAQELSVHSILDSNPNHAATLTNESINYLATWQKFLETFPDNLDLPSFPIWAMEFGADYPYTSRAPLSFSNTELKSFKGSFGKQLTDVRTEEIVDFLPSYVRNEKVQLPPWKIKYICQNRELYDEHKNWIDEWKPFVRNFPSSFQKLEWNSREGERDIWKYIIQFRASGIRVKTPDTFPSLVAITSQVPVIAWERRYMTVRECCKIQSLDELPNLPRSDKSTYKALGNAVNVDVVRQVADCLLKIDNCVKFNENV